VFTTQGGPVFFTLTTSQLSMPKAQGNKQTRSLGSWENLYTDQVGGYRPPHNPRAGMGLAQVGIFRFCFFTLFCVSFFFSLSVSFFCFTFLFSIFGFVYIFFRFENFKF
jgi:hypothetical protein